LSFPETPKKPQKSICSPPDRESREKIGIAWGDYVNGTLARFRNGILVKGGVAQDPTGAFSIRTVARILKRLIVPLNKPC